uniref:Uncharacterized protein n=1 Tax=Prorocentrum micans TaxID=2945 RepID=A0A7S2TCF8_PROMC|mmetsp:Transcript_2784/g.2203  ORF Transcript_2784/g.2203 Transcript_2784/m.2203 type:complete len:102 (+) Transcript_2784:211-516(+)
MLAVVFAMVASVGTCLYYVEQSLTVMPLRSERSVAILAQGVPVFPVARLGCVAKGKGLKTWARWWAKARPESFLPTLRGPRFRDEGFLGLQAVGYSASLLA